MKYGICNELFEGWAPERVFEYAAKLGYHGVEIAPFTLAEDCRSVPADRRTQLRAAAADSGIEVLGLHWLLVSPKGLHMNSPEKSVRDDTEEYLKALMDFCADLGGRVCVLGSPKQRTVEPPEKLGDAWKRSAEMLRRVGESAARRDVVLAFEPLAAGQTNFVNTMAEGTRLVEDVDHPGVRLHLDVIAMCAQGRPPAETLRLEGNTHLAHVHVNDPNRQGPGMGELDFAPIAEALGDIGYDGYVSVEAFDYSPGPEPTAEKSIETLKQVFGA
jgi:sugar phosphate isomerase/epimerase